MRMACFVLTMQMPVRPCRFCPSHPALASVPLLTSGRLKKGGRTYLAAVDVRVLDSRGDVALAADVHAVGKGLDHRGALLLVGLVEDRDDVLDLVGADLERGLDETWLVTCIQMPSFL